MLFKRKNKIIESNVSEDVEKIIENKPNYRIDLVEDDFKIFQHIQVVKIILGIEDKDFNKKLLEKILNNNKKIRSKDFLMKQNNKVKYKRYFTTDIQNYKEELKEEYFKQINGA